jgi:hypothetical protein
MKRILGFILIFLCAGFAFAQESFHKDSRNFDIKLDLAGYNGTLKDNQTDSVQNTSAASVVLTPQMAWAVGKAISLGGSIGLSHYLSDSASSQLNGLDANIIFDVHFLRRPKTDMMLGFKLGVGGIRLDANDGTGDVYGSMGVARDFHLMARFYVSEKLAIIATLGFPAYTFNKFGKNLKETYTIKLSGVAFGSGIAFKLPGQRKSGTQRNK